MYHVENYWSIFLSKRSENQKMFWMKPVLSNRISQIIKTSLLSKENGSDKSRQYDLTLQKKEKKAKKRVFESVFLDFRHWHGYNTLVLTTLLLSYNFVWQFVSPKDESWLYHLGLLFCRSFPPGNHGTKNSRLFCLFPDRDSDGSLDCGWRFPRRDISYCVQYEYFC